MKILLLGRDNSITHTVEDMLNSAEGWVSKTINELTKDGQIQVQNVQNRAVFDIIVANLSGFPESPKTIIEQIAGQFPAIPILVLYSYGQESLIRPLLERGATGYLQVGSSETKLFEAVQKVSDRQEHIFTETTY